MPIKCIGVGPGDKELITLKALKHIKSADKIIVPVKKEGSINSTALSIVEDYIEDKSKVVYLYFPMKKIIKGNEETEKYFRNNGKIINGFLSQGLKVVYLTLGDCNIYSTFTYVAEYIREKIEYVPGITSFLQGAALTGVPLCIGSESLAIVNMTDSEEKIEHVFELHDNIVVMKVSANPMFLKKLIIDKNREATFLSNIGLEEEEISSNLDFLSGKVPYFTVAHVKRNIG